MTPSSKTSVFLERKSYRQRRLRDAARMLPLLGVVLWLIPLMWNNNDDKATSNGDAMLYLFGVWIVLTVLSALITRALRPDTDTA